MQIVQEARDDVHDCVRPFDPYASLFKESCEAKIKPFELFQFLWMRWKTQEIWKDNFFLLELWLGVHMKYLNKVLMQFPM